MTESDTDRLPKISSFVLRHLKRLSAFQDDEANGRDSSKSFAGILREVSSLRKLDARVRKTKMKRKSGK